MPTGIYERTDYHRKVLSECHMGLQNSLGYKHTEEAKRKISEALRKRFVTPETKEKLSLSKTGDKHHLWKGGRTIDEDGYVSLYTPEHPKAQKNQMPEHRLVMEKYLGRYLKSEEIVHHIDGVRTNNEIENLMVLTRSEHLKLHRQMQEGLPIG